MKEREVTNFSAITVNRSRKQNVQAVYCSTDAVPNKVTYWIRFDAESNSIHIKSDVTSLVLVALALTKLTTLIAIASLSFIAAVKVLEARAFLWIPERVPTAFRLFCFILAINPLQEPSIVGAPSMQTPTNFSH